MFKQDKDPESLGDIMKNKKSDNQKKAPAYPWQDLALKIIEELGVPNFKRSAVFKVCKQHPKETVLIALNDTKELCKDEQAWKYFFKIIGERSKK